MPEPNRTQKIRLRSVFVSDVHLGSRDCRAAELLRFLESIEADYLFLVGDIIDFWKVRRGPHWAQSHNDVLQKLMRRVRKGTRLVYIPGNHDEGLRDYVGLTFGGIEIHRDTVHTTADGRRYLVLHGDEFDVVVRAAKWLAFLGDRGYELALWLNNPLNWVRRHVDRLAPTGHQANTAAAHSNGDALGVDVLQQPAPDYLHLIHGGPGARMSSGPIRLDQQARFEVVRSHNCCPGRAVAVERLGVHQQHARRRDPQRSQAGEQRVRQHPVPVVGDHHDVAAGISLFQVGEQARLGLWCGG